MEFDAFLLVSYGGPECQGDVRPFLDNLFAGKDVPAQRLEAAAEKYHALARRTGGYSPLNAECRALIVGILREFNQTAAPPTVYWGNLFGSPLLDDTVAEMARDGVRHAACLATSAFDSTAGNVRYADALDAARQKVGPAAPKLKKLALPFRHPLFLRAQADRLLEALAWATLNAPFGQDNAVVLFSAHSVPCSDVRHITYTAQLVQTCDAVMKLCGPLPWELVYQSRSGPAEHWIGPDIRDRVRALADEGRFRSVVVSPIGFFCENMETVGDLDLDVGGLCAELGVGFSRARAVGAAPEICRMIREMVFA